MGKKGRKQLGLEEVDMNGTNRRQKNYYIATVCNFAIVPNLKIELPGKHKACMYSTYMTYTFVDLSLRHCFDMSLDRLYVVTTSQCAHLPSS